MASIAVLPILIGLAVDYAIQLQARYDEAVEGGATGARRRGRRQRRGGPTIATACLATAAGFLALQLSPTPMVRSFGLLLLVGIVIAFLLALTAGFAALSLRREGADASPRAGGAGCRLGSAEAARAGLKPPRNVPPPGAARGQRGTTPRRQDPPAGALVCTRPRPPAASARRRARPGRPRLGRRDPDRHRLRYPLAGAAEPAGCSRPDRAAGRHRRLRRARRQRRGPRLHRPRDDSLDGRLQAAGAARERVRRARTELPRRRSLPRPGALGLPHQRRRQAEQAGHPLNPGGDVLLRPAPGRHPSIRRPACPATRRCSPSASAPSRWRASRR